MPRWKRGTDLTCALLALPVLAVGTLVMLTVTTLVSRGPIFFRQERVGLQGRRFTLLKFRTMKVAADPAIHLDHMKQLMSTNTPMTKLDGQRDPRLIPGGWWLRASGLDELPQVINVLRGEMSVVGPRPSLPAEFEQAQPAQRERVNAVPGLTGLWQVSGKNRTTFDEMIRLDVHYARHVALPLDFKIMLLTPVALLRQISDTRRERRPPARGASAPQSNPVAVAPIAGAPVR